MTTHTAMVENTPDGYLGRCSCGDRNTEFTGYGVAAEWCDKHEREAKDLRLNKGPRPSMKTLEKQYREKSQMLVYTLLERAYWLRLADELAERLGTKSDTLDGQLGLFETEGDTP